MDNDVIRLRSQCGTIADGSCLVQQDADRTKRGRFPLVRSPENVFTLKSSKSCERKGSIWRHATPQFLSEDLARTSGRFSSLWDAVTRALYAGDQEIRLAVGRSQRSAD